MRFNYFAAVINGITNRTLYTSSITGNGISSGYITIIVYYNAASCRFI